MLKLLSLAPHSSSPLFRDVGDAVTVSLWASCLDQLRLHTGNEALLGHDSPAWQVGQNQMNHLYFFFIFAFSVYKWSWAWLAQSGFPAFQPFHTGGELHPASLLDFTFGPFWTSLHFWTLISHFPLGKAGPVAWGRQISDSLSMLQQENFPKWSEESASMWMCVCWWKGEP